MKKPRSDSKTRITDNFARVSNSEVVLVSSSGFDGGVQLFFVVKVIFVEAFD